MNVGDVIILGEDPDLVEHVKNIKPEANYIHFNNDLFYIRANQDLTIKYEVILSSPCQVLIKIFLNLEKDPIRQI